jgi:DNA-binding winged helix-turn-helix (wHTH) protein
MTRYRFGRFVVDERSGELWDGSQRAPLQRKVHQLLLYLLQRP